MRTFFSAVCTALGALAVALGFICVANPHRPLFYLIDIFTLPILSVTAVLTALFMLVRQPRAAALGTLATVLLIIAMAPQVFPKQAPADANAKPVKLLWANMFVRNATQEKLLPWVAAKNPDIVALVEVAPAQRKDMIDKLKIDYPYMAVRYDMIVASRYPIANAKPRPAGFALVTLTVKTPQGPLNLAVTHLTRPWPFTQPKDQPRQFARLADALMPLPDGRMVLVGDFNTTPSAALLHDFTGKLDLHTVPALNGTWESALPSIGRVTIDNVLATRDLNLSRRETGPANGSDHSPVYVEIRTAAR